MIIFNRFFPSWWKGLNARSEDLWGSEMTDLEKVYRRQMMHYESVEWALAEFLKSAKVSSDLVICRLKEYRFEVSDIESLSQVAGDFARPEGDSV